MKLTPKVRIAGGIVLVVAGFIVGEALFFFPLGLRLLALLVAWALTIGGLFDLLYRQSEAPIATGIALVLVSPLVLFLILRFQIRVDPLVFFVLPGAIALYGIFLIVVGVAEKRREAAG